MRTFVFKDNYIVSYTGDVVIKIQNLVLGIVFYLMNYVLLQE